MTFSTKVIRTTVLFNTKELASAPNRFIAAPKVRYPLHSKIATLYINEGGIPRRSEGCKVFPICLMIVVLSVFSFLAYCRIKLGRRNCQSWASIIARLRPAWGGHASSCHYLWQEGLTVCPDDVWSNIHGACGLWTIFKNAGIMLEMIEFAERNCDAIDPVLFERLRSDALQVRMSALATLVQSAVVVSKSAVHINAFRAVSMYTGMTARMVQFIDQSAAAAMPDFVAAM